MDQAGPNRFGSPAAYDRWIGRYARQFAEQFVERVGVARGQRVLDVGCGPGALTGALVKRLGARSVRAIDPSEPFVEACRTRYEGVEVDLGSGESLPYDDRTFDAALCQLVVHFFVDAPQAVREMSRVTRVGGIVGGVAWDLHGDTNLLGVLHEVALASDPDEARARHLDEVPYTRTGEVGELWTGVGLVDVSVDELIVSTQYEDFDDLFDPLSWPIGPAGAYYASLPEAQQETFRRAVHDRLDVPDGPFELKAHAWCALGRTAEE